MNCANKLGIKYISHEWTKYEDDILKKFYPKEGRSVSERLKNRTPTACVLRANRLHLKYDSSTTWTKSEDDILKNYYPLEGSQVEKKLPNRTKSACYNRAQLLKIKKLKEN